MESERREKRGEKKEGDLITANYPELSGERFGDDWTFLSVIFSRELHDSFLHIYIYIYIYFFFFFSLNRINLIRLVKIFSGFCNPCS